MPVVWTTLRGAVSGRFASDLVATLAILVSAALQQPFVGLIIVLMQTGGEALERYAEGRASEAVRALEEAAPRTAHRLRDGELEDLRADDVEVGDTLIVRPGELVPCDAVVLAGRSHVDTSRLTGEPLPVTAAEGTRVMSGSGNGEGALTLRATALSRESQYARIVELVRSAQASKAPLQRVADRYAVWFTPLTIALCIVAYALTGDALRVLAVLAVATPCPLILATPVAILGGVNRAARRHVIVRHGTALEQLGEVTVAVFDKTGTITIGRPRVHRVLAAPHTTEGEVLRLASAVEQASGHLLARTLVEAAQERGIRPPQARNVWEAPGRGVTGETGDHQVQVGARSFVLEHHPVLEQAVAALDGGEEVVGLRAYVVVDGRLAGVVEYADALRPGLEEFFADLSSLGITRTLLVSGDRAATARAVASAVGIREVQGDLLPEGKVDTVAGLVRTGETVLMVGDGTNDAPALSAATVGIALAGHGGGITAEAADVVILADDLTRVTEAIRISRRTMRIARQCIRVGLGLSAVAMAFAVAGEITPAAGAVLQEGIDLAVIFNALRASRQPTGRDARGSPDESTVLR
jgi:heavy metal translocating P-type ATPase